MEIQVAMTNNGRALDRLTDGELIAYLHQNYDRKTRGPLQVADPSFYNILTRRGLLDHVPKKSLIKDMMHHQSNPLACGGNSDQGLNIHNISPASLDHQLILDAVMKSLQLSLGEQLTTAHLTMTTLLERIGAGDPKTILDAVMAGEKAAIGRVLYYDETEKSDLEIPQAETIGGIVNHVVVMCRNQLED